MSGLMRNRMPHIGFTRALVLLSLFVANTAFAAMTIGSGSVVNFGDGTFNLGCEDLVVAGQGNGTAETLSAIANLTISSGGTLAPGAGSVSLGGNFSNTGTFVPGTSHVAIVDACGNGVSEVSGATSFYDLAVTTMLGKQLTFPASVTQSIAHALTFQGVAGNLLKIVSSTPGVKALLAVDVSAKQTISYVNARDNTASVATIAPGQPSLYNSIDGGNLTNWFIGSANGGGVTAIPAPILGVMGRILLMIGFLLGAIKLLRRDLG